MTFQPWVVEFGDALVAHLSEAGHPLYLVQSRLRAGASVEALVRETGALVPLDRSLAAELAGYLRSLRPGDDGEIAHAG